LISILRSPSFLFIYFYNFIFLFFLKPKDTKAGLAASKTKKKRVNTEEYRKFGQKHATFSMIVFDLFPFSNHLFQFSIHLFHLFHYFPDLWKRRIMVLQICGKHFPNVHLIFIFYFHFILSRLRHYSFRIGLICMFCAEVLTFDFNVKMLQKLE